MATRASGTEKKKSKKDRTKSSKEKLKDVVKSATEESGASHSVMGSFEHGRLFARYGDPETGKLSWEQFQKMMQEIKVPVTKFPESKDDGLSERTRFDAGVMFERFDAGKSGTISKESFEKIYDELVSQKKQGVPVVCCGRWYNPAYGYMAMNSGGRGGGGPHLFGGCGCPPMSACVCGSRWTADVRKGVDVMEQDGSKPESKKQEDKCVPGCLCNHCCTFPDKYDYPYNCQKWDRQMSFSEPQSAIYCSPLPHLSGLPGEYDDAGTALLRRDFLHLQGLLEATLAPRIEAELRILERIEEVKKSFQGSGKSIENDLRVEFDAMIKRLRSAVNSKCSKADDVGKVHRQMLERISQFQYLAAGPRPRDALRMDSVAAHLSTSLRLGSFAGSSEDSSDPVIAAFRKQRERAKQAFLEQERCPHPLVMRDFINLFKDFEGAAQKLVDTPYSSLGMWKNGSSEGLDSMAKLDALKRDDPEGSPIRNEAVENRNKAKETDRLVEELKLKDQMIYTLVKERESFEQQKQQFLQEVDELAKASTEEIKSWAALHNETTREMQEKIASLQEQNRLLQERLSRAA